MWSKLWVSFLFGIALASSWWSLLLPWSHTAEGQILWVPRVLMTAFAVITILIQIVDNWD